MDFAKGSLSWQNKDRNSETTRRKEAQRPTRGGKLDTVIEGWEETELQEKQNTDPVDRQAAPETAR